MQGPYVLVMVSTGRSGSAKSKQLPALWFVSAYRGLSRPFKKNVKYVVLVRPTGWLKTLLAVVRPVTSRKSARKLKKVIASRRCRRCSCLQSCEVEGLPGATAQLTSDLGDELAEQLYAAVQQVLCMAGLASPTHEMMI